MLVSITRDDYGNYHSSHHGYLTQRGGYLYTPSGERIAEISAGGFAQEISRSEKDSQSSSNAHLAGRLGGMQRRFAWIAGIGVGSLAVAIAAYVMIGQGKEVWSSLGVAAAIGSIAGAIAFGVGYLFLPLFLWAIRFLLIVGALGLLLFVVVLAARGWVWPW